MDFLEILKAILYGIVEGVTEWLPVSSTGHMILLDKFVKLNVSPEFWEMFLVVIQLGAILAVVVLFWNKIFPFRFEKGVHIDKPKFVMWFKILVSCIPAIIIGLPFNDFIEEKFNNWFVVSVMLIVYGVMFLIVEDYNEKRQAKYNSIKEITWKTALLIGIFQVLSLIPGTSRSGSTIIGGILVGASRTVAAEYTFFLAIPVMFGASLLKIVKFGLNFTSWEVVILVTGMVVSFVVSILAIKFLMGYIKKHNFKVFGWYRIVLGIIVILFFTIFR